MRYIIVKLIYDTFGCYIPHHCQNMTWRNFQDKKAAVLGKGFFRTLGLSVATGKGGTYEVPGIC